MRRKRLILFGSVMLLALPLMAIGQKIYKYPYYHNFGTETNVKITFDSEIGPHSWLRVGGTDTVTVWYFRGADSTKYQIPPITGTPTVAEFNNVPILGGSGGGVRIVKSSGTSLILSGATDQR